MLGRIAFGLFCACMSALFGAVLYHSDLSDRGLIVGVSMLVFFSFSTRKE
jgi:hypothetical protein